MNKEKPMTEKYDLKALKAALLKSDDHVIETQIFGAKVLSAA